MYKIFPFIFLWYFISYDLGHSLAGSKNIYLEADFWYILACIHILILRNYRIASYSTIKNHAIYLLVPKHSYMWVYIYSYWSVRSSTFTPSSYMINTSMMSLFYQFNSNAQIQHSYEIPSKISWDSNQTSSLKENFTRKSDLSVSRKM